MATLGRSVITCLLLLSFTGGKGNIKQTEQVPIITTGKQIDPFGYQNTDGKKYLYHIHNTNWAGTGHGADIAFLKVRK